MPEYRIAIQFAAAEAPSFPEIMPVIERGVEYYNSKSLVARNPKQIKSWKILEDGRSLEVVLRSNAELPFPGKALRLLSEYLIHPDTGGLGHLIVGRQLFRMATQPVVDEKPVSKEREAIRSLLRLLDAQLEAANVTVAEISSLLERGETR